VNSVAILFHQYGDLDVAVELSMNHLRQLITLFDRTADDVLLSVSASEADAREFDAMESVIDLMRTVNTGNLEWR
jgi:hypothetical protein